VGVSWVGGAVRERPSPPVARPGITGISKQAGWVEPCVVVCRCGKFEQRVHKRSGVVGWVGGVLVAW